MKKAHVWRWAHYATHAKKRRTRKKYQRKLRGYFAPHIPPGVKVEISLISGPNIRTPYCVAIDVWEPVEMPPIEIKMEVEI